MALAGISGTHSAVVPVGFRWVVTDVAVVNRTGAAAAFAIVGTAAQLVWYWDPVYNANDLAGEFVGRHVLNAGESLDVQALSGTWDVTASGFQLAAP